MSPRAGWVIGGVAAVALTLLVTLIISDTASAPPPAATSTADKTVPTPQPTSGPSPPTLHARLNYTSIGTVSSIMSTRSGGGDSGARRLVSRLLPLFLRNPARSCASMSWWNAYAPQENDVMVAIFREDEARPLKLESKHRCGERPRQLRPFGRNPSQRQTPCWVERGDGGGAAGNGRHQRARGRQAERRCNAVYLNRRRRRVG